MALESAWTAGVTERSPRGFEQAQHSQPGDDYGEASRNTLNWPVRP